MPPWRRSLTIPASLLAGRKLQISAAAGSGAELYALRLVPLRDDLCRQYLVALMRFLGMLVSLFGELIGGQMIRFVVSGSSIMSVFRKVVKFS
jgi:hypothetical protein